MEHVYGQRDWTGFETMLKAKYPAASEDEIARMLGYTSIHYFSRHFKKVTKMTPSEYATSVKMLSRRGRGENV